MQRIQVMNRRKGDNRIEKDRRAMKKVYRTKGEVEEGVVRVGRRWKEGRIGKGAKKRCIGRGWEGIKFKFSGKEVKG